MMMPCVLLIEPDSILAQNYILGLKRAGYNVKHETSGQGALSGIDSFKPDIIILELLLPGHNGFEFLHEVRSYTDLHTTPIIILTFVSEPDIGLTSRQLGEVGVVAYMYKPITPVEDVLLAVEEALS